jgi:hypothetical protein
MPFFICTYHSNMQGYRNLELEIVAFIRKAQKDHKISLETVIETIKTINTCFNTALFKNKNNLQNPAQDFGLEL